MLPLRVRKIDLAMELGISVQTINLWIKAGKLPPPERPAYHRSEWPREALLPLIDGLRPDR